MRNFIILCGLAMAAACGAPQGAETPAENAEEAANAEVAEAEAEGAAAEAKEAAPAVAALALGDVLGASADHMGKEVTVKGMFGSMATEGEMVHVMLAASADEGAPSVMCMTDTAHGAAFDGLEANAEVMVKGTMADHNGAAMLQNCMKVEAEMADKTPEAAAEGEAAEGMNAEAAAEGAEAAKAEGGDAE